jgi:hypothetical protein
VNELQFADDVMARIRARGGAYNERAYLFVLATIEYLQSRLQVRRHVTGAELAWACRDFAREQFGLLVTQPGDHEGDFEAVYLFADAFGDGYEWQGVRGA